MENYLEKIRNKKVLVTGGLGFVGHNLVKTLIDQFGCTVIIVDNCCNSSPQVLGEHFSKVIFYEYSVLDSDKINPLMHDVNYIFHLACKQIATSSEDPLDDLRVNAESTLMMLDYIKNTALPELERFVYTSSCSVYGNSSILPVSENDSTVVLSNYAATKLLGENYALIYNRSYNVPTAVVRYSNVYGFGQSPLNPYCGVLGKFVHNAINGISLPIIGDGLQTRDYTFITDAVEATILAAVHPGARGDVFNVGTQIETSVNELASLINNYIQNVNIEILPPRDIDNIDRRSISSQKIKKKLGWEPKVEIKKGVEHTIKWYKSELNQN